MNDRFSSLTVRALEGMLLLAHGTKAGAQADFGEIVEIGSSEPELGDVNGDSEINVSDVTALVSSILGN